MITELLAIDQSDLDSGVIAAAADLIRTGRLVAFPTETVYGLGANALDSVAVKRIFEAKGRPNTNPLIVHVADRVQLLNVVEEWPETAEWLAERFWPGPLTFILPRRSHVPDDVTAGGPTVAVRCPNHPVAQALIRTAGVPIAAPSANRSTELSPTRAEHVWNSLNGRIDLILDGGPCPGGLESTVVDVTGDVVRLLRPGLISASMVEEVVGRVEQGPSRDGPLRSPGQLAKHYSPRTRLRLVHPIRLFDDLHEAIDAGLKVGVVMFGPQTVQWPKISPGSGTYENLTNDPNVASTNLYDTLHRLDRSHLDLILAELPPDNPEWAAIRDRLLRAATV